MSSTPPAGPSGQLQVRVRYHECDPMQVVHHAVYPVWFEMGRTELLRETGVSYRELEAHGVFLAVVSLEIRYRAAVRYDDLLDLETTLGRCTRAAIRHTYRLTRQGLLVAAGATTLACLDGAGAMQPVPEWLGLSRGRPGS